MGLKQNKQYLKFQNEIEGLAKNKGYNINLYYLKDKILENKTLHEKYEALSLIQRN